MKTTSKPKAPANTAPAPVKQDPTPAWAIGSATVDIHNDAKVARALACLLKEISGYAPTDPEEVEERQMQIEEIAGSVSDWTERVVEKVEMRLKLEALSAAARAK